MIHHRLKNIKISRDKENRVERDTCLRNHPRQLFMNQLNAYNYTFTMTKLVQSLSYLDSFANNFCKKN